jgi:hypothetical protein
MGECRWHRAARRSAATRAGRSGVAAGWRAARAAGPSGRRGQAATAARCAVQAAAAAGSAAGRPWEQGDRLRFEAAEADWIAVEAGDSIAEEAEGLSAEEAGDSIAEEAEDLSAEEAEDSIAEEAGAPRHRLGASRPRSRRRTGARDFRRGRDRTWAPRPRPAATFRHDPRWPSRRFRRRARCGLSWPGPSAAPGQRPR